LVRGPVGEGAATVLAQLDSVNIYAFDQACRSKAIGLAASLGLDRSLSINFLPNGIYDPKACLRHTLKAASQHNFPHHLLTFEIVETEGLADPAHLAAIVAEYRSRGFRIALDDFGTGYSGLARLADLRPDILKVDRILVKDCDRDTTRRRILANLLALGRDVGTDIVLEGVETEAEMLALRAIGGRFMQGFYFARPALETLVARDSIKWPTPARITEPAL
jgi:EAL domain-containing protein (putative c-di-GMP-specific phosphodiesterase class I)